MKASQEKNTAWSIQKGEACRQMVDNARGVTISIMCELHRRKAVFGAGSLKGVLARPDVLAFWSEQKTGHSRLARQLMEKIGVFDAGEMHRTVTRIASAMDAEALMICALDDQGTFNPDALDERAGRLLAFHLERAEKGRLAAAVSMPAPEAAQAPADVPEAARAANDDARMSDEAAAQFALQWVRGSAVYAMCSYRRHLEDYRGQPLRPAFDHPQVAEQWSAFRTKECGRWGGTIAHTMTEAYGLGAGLAVMMQAEADRLLALDDAGEFDPDNLDPVSQVLLDFVTAQMGAEAA